ncbi:Roundabout 2 [Bulinus truncatus]|nr:Roundabout 2 [Bulinus truncatus]
MTCLMTCLMTARQLDDGTLRIEKVQVVDEGVYVCVAENSAGTVEAVGRLSVQTHPSYLIAPKDLSVGRGRTAILQCVVTGNPDPTLFWAKGTEQQLLFPKQASGRYTVSSDGTLRIANVEYRDAGTYVCQALNALANAKSSATLTVTDDDDRPPPIIIAGPQNQTLEPKEVALLTCQAEGQPTPSIRWYKDNKSIIATDPRVTLLNSGTLQISDLKVNDSGTYICKAISETGETDWSATLRVSKQGPYQRNQKESALPGPPSKPKVSDVADTSVHLTWTPNDEMGQSPVYAYVVEYFSPQRAEGWKVATDSVSRDGYTVKDLLPATKYVFFVRAKNSFGVSAPSLLSDVITTREKRKTFTVNMPRDEIVKELNLLNLELKSGEGINSTAIRVKWEVATSLASIEGYIINYTEVDLTTNVAGKSEIIKITDPYQFRSYITDLRPSSWYQVCIKAYARDVTSRCSNSIKVPTKESVPKSPPEKVVIHRDGHSIHIRWLPPPKSDQNGEIKGYDIYCISEDNNSNCSTSASASDSSAVIKNVDIDGTYRIKIAARTSKGRGVWSSDQVLDANEKNLIKGQAPLSLWPHAMVSADPLAVDSCVVVVERGGEDRERGRHPEARSDWSRGDIGLGDEIGVWGEDGR